MEPFEHPFGFLCFVLHSDFTQALEYCQNSNIDCTDFTLHGSDYIVVFKVQDFFNLVQYCDDEALQYVKFVLL